MTRINNNIHVKSLTDEHLLAEHREIKRIPTFFATHGLNKSRIPKKFSLGTGHVLFFVDKPKYTLTRYRQIHQECLLRGFNVTDYSSNWNVYSQVLFDQDNYVPNGYANTLLVERISLRLTEYYKKGKCSRYYGSYITLQQAIKLLTDESIQQETDS